MRIGLVRGGRLDVVYNGQGPWRGEFEAKPLLNSGEDRWTGVFDGLAAVVYTDGRCRIVGSPTKVKIVVAKQIGLVDYGAVEGSGKSVGEGMREDRLQG